MLQPHFASRGAAHVLRLLADLRALLGARFLAAAVALNTLAVVAGLLVVIPTPYQMQLPGPVTDVQRVLQPNPERSSGALYLTTMYSDPASVGEWLYAKINPQVELVPREEARPANMGEQEYLKRLAGMMDESKVIANVVAQREAGYDVKITGQGAQIQDITDSSKAKGILQVGDIVIEAGGRSIATSPDLVAQIQAHRPGDVIQVKVKRGEAEMALDVPLGESPDEPGRARMGVVASTHLYDYSLPLQFELRTDKIGGPSAGLMFALGIYNALTPGDLTHGHKIAGTGTISTDGRVGPVGGVKYKIAAAEKAGAEVFLAPQDNVEEAQKYARKLRVVPVRTFKDAVEALRALPPA